MFRENTEEIRKADQSSKITTGDYEANIVSVANQPANGDKKGAWIVTFAISGGEFEGCEYTNFVTHSPKAAGIRAKFYRAIGYVLPEDGCVDENDFVGQPALISVENKNGQQRVTNVQRSARAADESDNQGDGTEDAAF